MFTAVVFTCALAVLAGSYFIGRYVFKSKNSGVKAVRANLAAFAVLSVVLFSVGLGVSAVSEDDAAPLAATASAQDVKAADNNQGLAFIASALAVGLAGIGGGIAVASGATAAIGATSEDPKNFGKALIFVALGEGIALYGLLISFLIYSTASKM